jgi:hypothetical protein
MTDLQTENLVGRIAGVIFEAIAASLACEQEELAVDILRRAAWATGRPEDARILGIVSRMDDEELEKLRRKVIGAGPDLKVIDGGNNAA